MYGKLKQLSIEELEVEIEDIAIALDELQEEGRKIDIQILELENTKQSLNNRMNGLSALTLIMSDLILEKQEETH